ncbi:mobilization protein, partial [Campylobacter upsaliensis]|nr:mobilization protein [Campylobacter upsaliensis]
MKNNADINVKNDENIISKRILF